MEAHQAASVFGQHRQGSHLNDSDYACLAYRGDVAMNGRPTRFCMFAGCPALVAFGYCDKHKHRARYCKQPGCGQQVTDSNWCADHQPTKQHDIRRGSSASRGYDRTWGKVQAAYKQAFPLCGRCQAMGTIKQMDMVHHIIAIADGGARLEYSNLLSLCWSCHGRVGPVGDSIEQVRTYKQLYQPC